MRSTTPLVATLSSEKVQKPGATMRGRAFGLGLGLSPAPAQGSSGEPQFRTRSKVSQIYC